MDFLLRQFTEDEDYSLRRVHGGDISEAFILEWKKDLFFVKYNTSLYAKDMFEKEARALRTINGICPGSAPHPITVQHAKGKGAIIVLEYVSKSSPTAQSENNLANNLSEVHRFTANQFGYDEDNYIGILPQSNQKQDNYISFYLNDRLIPQTRMAAIKRLVPEFWEEKLRQSESLLESIIPKEEPSFLHGDLWSGNVLHGRDGNGYFIDPAVYFGHREADIAMTMLFGGFSSEFYNIYQQSYPMEKGWRSRMDIHQLYYLLVHLNLFGSSYFHRVNSIMAAYFI